MGEVSPEPLAVVLALAFSVASPTRRQCFREGVQCMRSVSVVQSRHRRRPAAASAPAAGVHP